MHGKPDDDSKTTGELRTGELRLGVAARGDLRWTAVDVTAPLEEARLALDLSPLAAVAMGRALAAAALLLRFTTKQPGKLVLEVLGDGPLGKVMAEADSDGRLRGLVGQPQLPSSADGSLALAPVVGGGTLRVTQENARGRYSSHVELVSGEIGKDLVHFLEQSQQIHSAALLGVLPRPSGIAAAGGVLVEAFPGAPEQTLAALEGNIAGLDGVSAELDAAGIGGLCAKLLAGFDRDELERHTLRYRCRCDREQLRRQLATLSSEDLGSIADAGGRFTAVCAFCAASYTFDRDELRIH